MSEETDETATGTMEVPHKQRLRRYWIEVGDRKEHRSYVVPEGGRLLVGSHRNCDIVLRDRTVSNVHCELSCKGGMLRLKDLGSKNGLYAGGARVKHAQLSIGASFVVGRIPFAIQAEQVPLKDNTPLPGVIGTSTAMMQVAAQVRRLARLSVPILIRGATGTGKERIAHAIHALSPRSEGPFLPLNLGAVPPSLAAAELFGHQRGAFTDAGRVRKGAFVAAHEGTLFLDEIGEVDADVQVLLLRALEQKEVQPLGSDRPVAVNVRVIAATWSPLEEQVQARRFREDLFHRLAVGTIYLPPLRERKSDLAALAEHLVGLHRDELGEKHFSPGAIGRLMAYHWPGNVRELANVVLRAASKTDQAWIGAQDIDAALRIGVGHVERVTQASARALVMECDGNVSLAARRCGVPRTTFRGWLTGRRRGKSTSFGMG